MKSIPRKSAALPQALLISAACHLLLVLALMDINWSTPAPEAQAVLHAKLAKLVQQEKLKEQSGKVTEDNAEVEQAETKSSIANPLREQTEKKQEQQASLDQVTTNSKTEQQAFQVEEKSNKPADTKQREEQAQQVKETTVAEQDSTAQRAKEKKAQVSTELESQSPTYVSYHKLLTQYLTQRLAAPDNFQGSLRLRILLAYGGIPIEVSVIESSGHTTIDEWAKRQAIAAGPYPAIPKELGSSFQFSPTLVFDDNTSQQ